MRKFKTAADNRTNYIYYFNDGSKCVITPGEDGENTTIIAQLHAMDDEQVDADRREGLYESKEKKRDRSVCGRNLPGNMELA